jgi:hypothetical protein
VSSETIQAAVGRALDAYVALAELGEEIEDEWSYVNDLTGAWRERLEALVVARGEAAAKPEESLAVDGAIDEIARIVDPHRAIDWLSTFPQVVVVAFGERP